MFRQDLIIKLFEIMCKITKVPYKADVISYLIETHYKPIDRPMRMCQPRDLLLQVKNYCRYTKEPLELSLDNIDFAVENKDLYEIRVLNLSFSATPMVIGSGPWLPADATTTIPACHAVITSWLIGSSQ